MVLTGPLPALLRTRVVVKTTDHTDKGRLNMGRTPQCHTLLPYRPTSPRTPPTPHLLHHNTQRTPHQVATHLRTQPTPHPQASRAIQPTVTPRRLTQRTLRTTINSLTRLTRHRRHIPRLQRCHRRTLATRTLTTSLLLTAGPRRMVPPTHPQFPRLPATLRPAIIRLPATLLQPIILL